MVLYYCNIVICYGKDVYVLTTDNERMVIMKKFIIMIDYKAGTGKVFDYIPVTAHDIVEAIEIADAFMATDVYLMHILEKSGKTDRTHGIRTTEYTARMTRRSGGWDPTNQKNGESVCRVREDVCKDFTNYSVL